MFKNRYQISHRQMLEGISKLELKPGDVLVVEHAETLKYLEGLGRVVNFTVPLVYAPGGLKRLSRQDLLNLLEQVEEGDKSVLPGYEVSGPMNAPL